MQQSGFNQLTPEQITELCDFVTTVVRSFDVRIILAPTHWSTEIQPRFLFCPHCKHFKGPVIDEVPKEKLSKWYRNQNKRGSVDCAYDVFTDTYFCCPRRNAADLAALETDEGMGVSDVCRMTQCVPLDLRGTLVEFYGKLLVSCAVCQIPAWVNQWDSSERYICPICKPNKLYGTCYVCKRSATHAHLIYKTDLAIVRTCIRHSIHVETIKRWHLQGKLE